MTCPPTAATRLGTGACRPGTGAKRPGTGATRPGTGAKRPGTGFNRGAPAYNWDSDDEDEVSQTPAEQDIDSAEQGNEGGADLGLDASIIMIDRPGSSSPACNDALAEALPLAEPLEDVARDFVAPLVALFGEDWTRCFYSRHWQCRVAALSDLVSTFPGRFDHVESPSDLLDGTMRAVHEGLGDQNVKVYSEACRCVSAIVPPFCAHVDAKLLVAHLAPLLKQLCLRMGDSKEIVRTATTQSLFSLL